MADQPISSSGIRRSAVYSYLRPVISGRRVLEVGCGTGEATAHLIRLGANSVTGAGSAQEIAGARSRQHQGALSFVTMASDAIDTAGTFDLVLVPDATTILRGHGPIQLSGLLSLLAPSGHLACIVSNGDQGEGIPYFDVLDALTPHFSKVRMFGQTPFMAFGIAEFDEAATDLRVDAELAEQENEEPTHYIALAGPEDSHVLGYALIQIPNEDLRTPAQPNYVPAGTGNRTPDTTIADLRHKLTESEGKAEGLLRVSRAQSEEIEELRARLRRSAEARADLDEEVRRLRKSLIEADESVVNLTRKTTEEMTVLAQRLTSGLRTGESAPSPGLTEELRRRESELAERESALSERDDRIAALEAAKQEAIWRADTAEDQLDSTGTELAGLRNERDQALEQVRQNDDLLSTINAHERTIEEFQRAAAVHLEEVNRLRDAANEQASLVTELEDELRTNEARLTTATADVTRLQKALIDVEEADRSRRSRLAELEGLMLRAEHASVKASKIRQKELADYEHLKAQIADDKAETDGLRAQIAANLTETDDLRVQIAASQAETDGLRVQIAANLAETDGLRVQIAASQAEADGLRTQIENGQSEADSLRSLVAASQSNADGLRAQIEISRGEIEDLRAQIAARQSEVDSLGARLEEAQKALAIAMVTPSTNAEYIAELEHKVRASEEREHRLAEIRIEAPDPEEVYERLFNMETQYQAATMAASRVPELEGRIAELEVLLALASSK